MRLSFRLVQGDTTTPVKPAPPPVTTPGKSPGRHQPVPAPFERPGTSPAPVDPFRGPCRID